METKKFQPAFQMVANTIQKIVLQNTIINISDTQDLHRNFSVETKDIIIENHNEYKSAGLDIEVIAVVKEKKIENPKQFKIEIIVSGVFTDSVETSDEYFKNKLKINGTAALYSIARGCITNISSQSLAEGKIVLPLVNFMEVSEESENI